MKQSIKDLKSTSLGLNPRKFEVEAEKDQDKV
jgi:hypothetical protein